MAENFSPSGTSISSSTVGIIDDPNFTVYVGATGNDISNDGTEAKPFRTPHKALEYLRNHFITRNGFATIKCGAGRYSFTSPLEIRHPQGQRIGIRGTETTDYILAKCSDWRSSHASASSTNRPIDIGATNLSGTSACRYYETKVHLNDLDWASSGNKLNPASVSGVDGNGVVNGISGDFVIVRDWTFAHELGYDTVHNDWGQDSGVAGQALASTDFKNENSSRRAALIGAHQIHSNSRGGETQDGVADGAGYVRYHCKYYNYPYKFEYTSTTENDDQPHGEKIAWFGGWMGKLSEAPAVDFDIPGMDDTDAWPTAYGWGDYFSNPFPTIAAIAPGAGDTPMRFGNTAEGWTHVDEIPTAVLQGYKSDISGTAIEPIIRDVQPTDTHHCTLNRMSLTHVRTVFEMKDVTKPCIHIDGGELGFIQDLAMEGGWQQFGKHMNDNQTARSNSSVSGLHEALPTQGVQNHCGILIEEGTLLYKLGSTGDSSAQSRFTDYDRGTVESDDVTILNVAVNGFHFGVRAEHSSYANVSDIAISNCRYGIWVGKNSTAMAHRSVISGMEYYGIWAEENSICECNRSIVSQCGYPQITIDFYNKGTDGITTGFSDKSFRCGDSLVLNQIDNENKVGIVDTWRINNLWGAGDLPGHATLYLYDYAVNDYLGNLITTDDLQTHGLKLEHTGTETDGVTPIQTGDATTYWDTDPTNGYLSVRQITNKGMRKRGGGMMSSMNSMIFALNCGVFDCLGHGYRSSHGGEIRANRSVVHRCGVGFAAQWESKLTCQDSKALNCRWGMRADVGGMIVGQQSIIENCAHPIVAKINSTQHSGGMHIIEGLSRYVDHVYNITDGSFVHSGNSWYVTPTSSGTVGTIPTDNYPANWDKNITSTSHDYTISDYYDG